MIVLCSNGIVLVKIRNQGLLAIFQKATEICLEICPGDFKELFGFGNKMFPTKLVLLEQFEQEKSLMVSFQGVLKNSENGQKMP